MRYIEMHRRPAAYVLGSPPSRGRDVELEGGVNACYVDTYTSPETLTCEVLSNGVVEISLLPAVLVKLRFRLDPVTQKPLAHCNTYICIAVTLSKSII